MSNNTYMIVDSETNRVLAENMPLDEMLMLLSMLCRFAPEVRDYSVMPCYFEKRVGVKDTGKS